jgi:hypothetical protein
MAKSDWVAPERHVEIVDMILAKITEIKLDVSRDNWSSK